MRKIITIQHTQSEQHINGMIGSWGSWALTELGVEQAHNIGKNLLKKIKNERYVMYSSDLPRARQTAEIISGYLKIETNHSSLLREFDLGIANGKTKQWARENNLCSLWPGTIDWAKSVDDKVFENAESKRDVWNRMLRFCNEVVNKSNDNIILVSHDGTLSLFFALWLGMDIEMLNKCNISGKSGGVSFLQEDAERNRSILRLNDMSYIL